MSTQRNGFKDGTKDTSSKAGGSDGTYHGYQLYLGSGNADLLKGHKSGPDLIDAGNGDDVILGYGGMDILVGGSGDDDLSGGLGNDQLIGGLWDRTVDNDADIEIGHWVLDAGIDLISSDDDTYSFAREFTQDNATDDFVAESSYDKNGTDIIYGYDQSLDVIEINALFSALQTIANADYSGVIESVTAADLVDAGYIYYDDGDLSIDLSGTSDFDIWFNIKIDDFNDTGTTNPGDSQPLDPSWSYADSVTVEIVGLQFTFFDPDLVT